MTRDDVMEMPDVELRIKAAELTREWFTCSVEDGVPSGLAYLFPDEKDEGYQELPDYINDIRAALELVQGHDEWWIATKSHGDEHQCDILRHQGEVSPCWSGKDSSLPRAITRAFVLAIETE